MINLFDQIGFGYVATFFLGLGLVGRFACGFILLTEVTPTKHQGAVGTAYLVLDVLATLYVTLFLRFVSNNASIIVWIGLVLNIVALVGAFWLVESPGLLVTQGCQEEAIKALN